MVIWFIIMIGLMAGCVWIGKKKFRSAKHGATKVAAISFVITGLWLTWFAVSMMLPRIGSDIITKVPVDNDPMYECHTIWYDREEDRYFYTMDSLWNPCKMIYRVYLDSEKVEQYVEIERQLKDIGVFEESN